MAKIKKGKKTKKKPNKIGSSSVQMKRVMIPENTSTVPSASTEPTAPVPHENTKVTASEPEVGGKEGPTDNNEQKMGEPNNIPGYIFMCNPSTKIECYRYRVFGLPMGKKDVVERIKPGAKLFLYDFELKLLYGVYEATCCGKLHLEPSAFRGKFPAQVKFKIFKECLPMPEISLRNVIRENYTGSKFNQELSRKLVRNLMSTFRPLTSSDTQPPPRFMHRLPVPNRNVPYIPEHQPIQSLPYQHMHHRASYYEHPPQASNHLPPWSSYYAVPTPQQPSPGHDVARLLHDPLSYSRTIEGPSHHLHQISDLERKYLQMPSPHGDASSYAAAQPVPAYNPIASLGTTQQEAPLSHHHYAPLLATSYQENVVVPYDPAAAGLTVEGSSVPQPHGALGYFHQLASSVAHQPVQHDHHVSGYYSHASSYLQQQPPQSLAPPGVEPQAAAGAPPPPPVPYYYSHTGQ